MRESIFKLLRRIKNIAIDIEVLEDEITANRVESFLKVAAKVRPRHIKVLAPEQPSEEQIKLIRKYGLSSTDVFIRPKSLYRTYSLIHKIFGKVNPNWIECRQTIYLNYFRSNYPIHRPNEFNVYPTLEDSYKDCDFVPVICPLRTLYTCNIVRNCINNCIYCYVPCTGAPQQPLVVCVNMPEKVKNQIKRMKKPYTITDFGSITDPCNPLIDNVFKVFRETFLVLKEHNYPALILTKSNPSKEILEKLNYDNALLAFSLYHLDPNIKKQWEINAPTPSEILKSMKEARKINVRLAARLDIIPGYNDNIYLLQKIVKILARYDIEHLTAGSLRARPQILRNIKSLNPSGYKAIISTLDSRKYSDNSMRPRKDLRILWYRHLSRICGELKVPFSLCKEEPELVKSFSRSKCLCLWVQN